MTTRARGGACYQVQVQWQGHAFYSVHWLSHYATAGEALQAAIRSRNKAWREMGRPISDRHLKSGATGISRQTIAGHPYFVAHWFPEPGKRARAKVSIDKHGEEKALRMAEKKRRDGMRAAQK